LNKKLYWQTPDFELFYHIGLEPKHTVRRRRYASVIWNSGKWNSVKWNEIRNTSNWSNFCMLCQRQLGFLAVTKYAMWLYVHLPITRTAWNWFQYYVLSGLHWHCVASTEFRWGELV